MSEQHNKPLSTRERIALRLILLGIGMLEPFKLSHFAKYHIAAIRDELGDDTKGER